DTIVVSSQHSEDVDMADLEKDIIEKVIKVAIPQEYFDEDTKIYVNPTGRFVVGGPMGDTGVTGRKIIVDTYGGMCRHGGGALSGKDPSKVDRSGLYMTRYICKNLVAAGVARRLEVQVAYAIGMSHPVAVYADSYGTGVISDDKIVDIINEVFDLRPRAIIKKLGLDRPIYRESANYGHLGRNIFPWEKLDKVEEIKEKLARI
ncbi:MAG: methionine adenosyltransferase domain-containing protein, partial [Clostridia bacterium]|nr:methionine adenosyltransferase domain-containing protein [Clostridia bacterium]